MPSLGETSHLLVIYAGGQAASVSVNCGALLVNRKGPKSTLSTCCLVGESRMLAVSSGFYAPTHCYLCELSVLACVVRPVPLPARRPYAVGCWQGVVSSPEMYRSASV